MSSAQGPDSAEGRNHTATKKREFWQQRPCGMEESMVVWEQQESQRDWNVVMGGYGVNYRMAATLGQWAAELSEQNTSQETL